MFISPSQRGLSTCHPNLPVTNFPIMFFSSPWPVSQTIGHSPGISIQSYFWPFFDTSKMTNQMNCLKFCLLGRNSITSFLSDVRERGRCVATVYFQMMPACCIELYVNRAPVLSSSVSWFCGIPMRPQLQARWEGNVEGLGIMDI